MKTTIATAVTLAVIAAACGSDDDQADESTPTNDAVEAAPEPDTTDAPGGAVDETPVETADTTEADDPAAGDAGESATIDERPCDADPEILTTADGVDFVRTPDACFSDLPGWDYEAQYVEINGLRQAYVDEGPADGDPILLLHGQPSWSYLYRDMIPGLVDAGHRVIAMDHLGMGRSDKPIDLESYRFDDHVDRLDAFVTELALDDAELTLFAQDWGSVIGLWHATENLDTYDRIVIGNGGIPTVDEVEELPADPEASSAAFAAMVDMIPDQQPAFFDEDGNPLLVPGDDPGATADAEIGFGQWIAYARDSEDFEAGRFVEALTYRPLDAEEEAAYDAPFPSRVYMAGTRAFPGLLNELVGRSPERLDVLATYEGPFLTIFGGNDPGLNEQSDAQDWMSTALPGAAGQPHHRYDDASHFLQTDRGEDIARRVNEFIASNPL